MPVLSVFLKPSEYVVCLSHTPPALEPDDPTQARPSTPLSKSRYVNRYDRQKASKFCWRDNENGGKKRPLQLVEVLARFFQHA